MKTGGVNFENNYIELSMDFRTASADRHCFAGAAEPFTKAISCDSGTWYRNLDCVVHCNIQPNPGK